MFAMMKDNELLDRYADLQYRMEDLEDENDYLKEEYDSFEEEYNELNESYSELEYKYDNLKANGIYNLDNFKYYLTVNGVLDKKLERIIDDYMRYRNEE